MQTPLERDRQPPGGDILTAQTPQFSGITQDQRVGGLGDTVDTGDDARARRIGAGRFPRILADVPSQRQIDDAGDLETDEIVEPYERVHLFCEGMQDGPADPGVSPIDDRHWPYG